MNTPDPLFADLATAARQLCMKPSEFKRHVDEGHLPPPVKLDRWDMEQVVAVMRGSAAVPKEDFEL